MKKIIGLSIVVLLVTATSCNQLNEWFGKSGVSEKEVEALVEEKKALERQLKQDSAAYERQIAAIRNEYEQKLTELQKKIDKGEAAEKKAYYVIVGSFKNMDYAREYAQKIRAMGYEGEIIDGPNQFNLVTSGTYETLRASLPSLQNARSKIASKAWVYFD